MVGGGETSAKENTALSKRNVQQNWSEIQHAQKTQRQREMCGALTSKDDLSLDQVR